MCTHSECLKKLYAESKEELCRMAQEIKDIYEDIDEEDEDFEEEPEKEKPGDEDKPSEFFPKITPPAEEEKPDPKMYIEQYPGRRIEPEKKEEGMPKKYVGGGIPVRECPVCEYTNSINTTECKNCKMLYKKIKKALKDAGIDANNPDRRKFALEQLSSGMKYGPSVLEKVYSTNGTTILDNSTVKEVPPSFRLNMEHKIDELNSQRNEIGDIVTSKKTGLPVPMDNKNFFSFSEILNKLSVPKAETDDAIMTADEFMKALEIYNSTASKQNKLEPVVAFGTSFYDPGQDPERSSGAPAATEKEFFERYEMSPEEWEKYSQTAERSYRPTGYFSTIWAWNDYVSPLTKTKHVGVSSVFADRVAYLNDVLTPMASRKTIQNKIAKAIKEIQEADSAILFIKSKLSKYDTLLLKLRKTEPESNKTKALEKQYGADLDAKQEQYAQAINKKKIATEDLKAAQDEMDELS